VAIIEKATQEFDVGWVFFYQSSRFLKTGDTQGALVGNAPLFVSRQDGRGAFISCHRPIVESIDAYRACGDPNAHEEPQLTLTGWLAGANKVQAIALIRRYSRLTLAVVRIESVTIAAEKVSTRTEAASQSPCDPRWVSLWAPRSESVTGDSRSERHFNDLPFARPDCAAARALATSQCGQQ